jgi:hypothetical protein
MPHSPNRKSHQKVRDHRRGDAPRPGVKDHRGIAMSLDPEIMELVLEHNYCVLLNE